MAALTERAHGRLWLTAVLAAGFLVCGRTQSSATQINEQELTVMGWTQDRGALPNNTSCNYMYVNHAKNLLLYYGMSTNCKLRLSQHERAVLEIRPFINAYDNAVQAQAPSKLDAVRSDFVKWATTEANVSGDSCLAAISVDYNWVVYYYPTNNAADVEECVLFAGTKNLKADNIKGFKGSCNKIGSADTSQQWVSVKNTLRACQASSR